VDGTLSPASIPVGTLNLAHHHETSDQPDEQDASAFGRHAALRRTFDRNLISAVWGLGRRDDCRGAGILPPQMRALR
jgi:hypothetical protein